jgi:GNAT superfamily N-acetyltransferase
MKFNDKRGRAITLRFNDEGNLQAFYNGMAIAEFEFYLDEENPQQLWELVHMDVNANYQRAGIGVEMMRFAVAELDYFVLPLPINFGNTRNYLSEEGAGLVNYCFKNNVLSPEFEKQYQVDEPYPNQWEE